MSPKGFIHHAMRRLVWPLLLNATAPILPTVKEEDVLRKRRKLEKASESDSISENAKDEDGVTESPECHRDEYQVELDVNRSFVHLPIDEHRDRLRKQLSELIVTTLRKYPALNYFQGYHDIISIILIVSEDDMDLAYRMTFKLSLFHIRDSMMTGLDPALGYLRLLKRILAKADPTLAAAVEQASSLPYFSLSWVLTLMAHDLTSVDIVSRIFDFLLAHNPAMVSYLSAAIVMAKKDELDQLDPDVANDPATLHTVLGKLPPLTAEPPLTMLQSPSRSVPSSPRQSFSSTLVSLLDSSNLPSNYSTSSLSSLADPDVNVPAYRHSLPTGSGRSRQSKRPVSVESLFQTTTELYAKYPLDYPGIDADTIFGPKSAVYTWSNRDLSESEAEQIVQEGTDVIIVETLDTDKDGLGRFPISDKLTRQQRVLQIRYVIHKVFVVHRRATFFTFIGIAGAILALSLRDHSHLQLGSRNWLRENWLVKWCMGKL